MGSGQRIIFIFNKIPAGRKYQLSYLSAKESGYSGWRPEILWCKLSSRSVKINKIIKNREAVIPHKA